MKISLEFPTTTSNKSILLQISDKNNIFTNCNQINKFMKVNLLILTLYLLLTACHRKEYFQAAAPNPVYISNCSFRSFEDLRFQGFAHLVNKYRIDTVFHGETDEFKRILLLRHWIKCVIKIDDHGEPYPGEGSAEGILDAALKGHGFHCGHYMIVQNAVMNAFGYVTRTLGAGPGAKGGPDGHHGINEVWVNKFNKWFLSDAKYDHHFEKNGIPLSALEIREEFLKNGAADIIKVKGPERVPTDADPETHLTRYQNAQTYTWIEWHGYNDMFTAYGAYKELLLMYKDKYFDTHTWIWDNKPHWAYSHPECLKLVESRDSLYWTPNTIGSTVAISGDSVRIDLTSSTPNLDTYEMRQLPEVEWKQASSVYRFKAVKDKDEIHFRVKNLAGVTGPEHVVVVGVK